MQPSVLEIRLKDYFSNISVLNMETYKVFQFPFYLWA